MFVLIFLCVLPPAMSFLIDVSTPIPPKVGTLITDGHYNALMDFLMQERQSRQNLEVRDSIKPENGRNSKGCRMYENNSWSPYENTF